MQNNFDGNRVFDTRNGNLYIQFVLGISIPILLYFSYICIFIENKIVMGVADFIAAICFSIDLIYLFSTKKRFKNLILTLAAFSVLCFLIPLNHQTDHYGGRMWLLLLPSAFLFTRRTRRSFILVLSIPGVALLGKFMVSLVTMGPELDADREQFFVYILLTLMTYLFSISVTDKAVEIEQQHYFNGLTGLPNRHKLTENLEYNEYKVIALINLDRFKNINSLYGITVGDKVLIEIGKRLEHEIKKYRRYSLYKLHADEFAISIKGCRDIYEEVSNLENLISASDKMITVGLFEIYPSISIGVGHGYEHVIEDAGIALRNAKKYRKSIIVFDKNIGIKEQYKRDLKIVYKLKSGLQNDGIIPYYQPIIDIKTGMQEKFECLARLKYHNEILSPDSFLKLSKEAKVYSKITKSMVNKCFNNFKDSGKSFSLNLDWDDIVDDEINHFIYDKIDEYRIGDQLTFELLETEEIRDTEKVLEFIDTVKAKGCKIAIDDFGSGFSNFDYLLKFKLDYLKIDGSLIKNIDVDKKSYAMTKSIVLLAKELGIKTIAEHIDKESIFRIIEELDIDYGQGFYWSAPEPEIG